MSIWISQYIPRFLLSPGYLDHKEGWALKNWCFWTVVLEKTLEIPLHCKEIQPVNPKGNQSWMFIGRTDAETPILWLPNVKNWLIWKDPDAWKDWRWEEKGTAEDEMVGCHHWLNGHEFEQALDVGWWWTGKPAVLQSMGSHRVGHDWTTELKWTEWATEDVCGGWSQRKREALFYDFKILSL